MSVYETQVCCFLCGKTEKLPPGVQHRCEPKRPSALGVAMIAVSLVVMGTCLRELGVGAGELLRIMGLLYGGSALERKLGPR